ncbi:hypothetical protein CHCC14814_3252 [Bacillus paralicheniformis]|nr:hypothetical protein CHCC14814_3252 [Bacillus paralicheniformis]
MRFTCILEIWSQTIDILQYEAYQHILSLTEKEVDWAY